MSTRPVRVGSCLRTSRYWPEPTRSKTPSAAIARIRSWTIFRPSFPWMPICLAAIFES